MVSDYHYDGLTKFLQRMAKRYSESHEDGRAIIADGMEVKRTAAIPMAALWTPNIYMNQNDQTKYTADIRESASVAIFMDKIWWLPKALPRLALEGRLVILT